MRVSGVLVLMIVLCAGVLTAHAQTDAAVEVPDLTGLSVSQAAAALNTAGLVLGQQTVVAPGEAPDQTPGGVIGQSVAAGSSVTPGTAVDITVVRAPNMRLIYGETFLTLVNPTDAPADLRALTFAASNGAASLAAGSLIGGLAPGNCLQVWSVSRTGPQPMAECAGIERWQSTTNPQLHFWTTANNVQQFSVLQDGAPLATCPAAPVGSDASPQMCDFYYSGGGASSDLVEFLYFVYTPEAIALINISDSGWMPTDATNIYNHNPQISIPGVPLRFGDPVEVFPETFRRRVGNTQRLAPGQCLVITTAPTQADASPEDCHVVAQRDLQPNVAFWLADFEVEGVTTGIRATCPAATAEQVTVCIVPR